MSPSPPQDRLEALAAQAQARAAEWAAERERTADRAWDVGDLCLVPAAAELPVQWALLERSPEAPGRFFAVPADANPFVGSADLEAPDRPSTGPLTLRCAFGGWVEAGSLETSLRTGALEPGVVFRARRKVREIEQGTLHASPLALETEADPAYQDWIAEVVRPARAFLDLAPGPQQPLEKAPPERRPRRWASARNPYALAASLLFTVSLGSMIGLFWQNRRMADLSAQAMQARQTLLADHRRLAGDLERTQSEHLRQLEALARERQADHRRIEDLEARLNTRPAGPITQIQSLFLEPRDIRGELKSQELAGGVRYVLFSLEVTRTDAKRFRVEVWSVDPARKLWSEEVPSLGKSREVTVALPRSLFTAGEYRVKLFALMDGQASVAGDYGFKLAP